MKMFEPWSGVTTEEVDRDGCSEDGETRGGILDTWTAGELAGSGIWDGIGEFVVKCEGKDKCGVEGSCGDGSEAFVRSSKPSGLSSFTVGAEIV
jgi:hypothetical protein